MNDGFGAQIGVPKGAAGSRLKGHVRGIHGVRCAVIDHDFHAGNRKLQLGPFGHTLPEALFARGNILRGNGAAEYLVFKNKFCVADRFDIAGNASELSGAAGLLFMRVVEIGPLRNGFTVSYPGIACGHFRVVFALHPLDIDVQMQLAHAFNDGLVGFRIHMGLERRVLLGEAVQGFGHGHLRLVVFRHDRQRNDRLGHVHRGHGHIDPRRHKRVSRRAFDPEKSSDVTGAQKIDVFHLIGVHPDDAADFDFLAVANVHDGRAFFDGPFINADIRKLSVLAVFQLECQRNDRLFRIAGQNDRLFMLIHVQGDILHFRRGGKQIGHSVKQGLNRFVFISGSHVNRGQLPLQCPSAQGGVKKLGGNFLLLQNRFRQFVGKQGCGVNQRFSFGGCFSPQMRRNVLHADLFAAFSVKINGLHRHQIDHAFQFCFQTDGNLHGHGVMPQFGSKLFNNPERIGAAAVAFIDKRDAGDLVALHLLIDGDGLGLHASDGAQNQNRAVQHTQGSFHFDGEIHVARRIDNVDFMALPFAIGCRGGNRDASFLFQVHGIHGRAHTVFALHVMNRVNSLGIKQNPLAERGLTGVDMRTDSDIAYFLIVKLHGASLSQNGRPDSTKKNSPHLEESLPDGGSTVIEP